MVIGGEGEAGSALGSALAELGLNTRFLSPESFPQALVGVERDLSAERPRAAVAVGTGEAAMALAITAAKLGVPLAASFGDEAPEGADQRRILSTLASLDAGSDPERAAGLIAAWVGDQPSAPDLDSGSLIPNPRTPR